MDLLDYIVEVPDWPKRGVCFKDITPLLADGPAYWFALNRIGHLAHVLAFHQDIDAIASIESRGFLFGAPLAAIMPRSFIPIRKPGKLPRPSHKVSYSLEYGEGELCMHKDVVKPGAGIILVDDVLATGGTAEAGVRLLQEAGAHVLGCVFLIELKDLGGRQKLSVPVQRVLEL